MIEKVIKIIQDVFSLWIEERNNLSECFNSKAELKNDNQWNLLYLKENVVFLLNYLNKFL